MPRQKPTHHKNGEGEQGQDEETTKDKYERIIVLNDEEEEEKDCLVVRQAKRASGLSVRKEDKTVGGYTHTAMPVRVWGTWPFDANMNVDVGVDANETHTKMGEDGGEKEVCLLHFQGAKSKELIVPFADFLKGKGKGEGENGGKSTFVLP